MPPPDAEPARAAPPKPRSLVDAASALWVHGLLSRPSHLESRTDAVWTQSTAAAASLPSFSLASMYHRGEHMAPRNPARDSSTSGSANSRMDQLQRVRLGRAAMLLFFAAAVMLRLYGEALALLRLQGGPSDTLAAWLHGLTVETRTAGSSEAAGIFVHALSMTPLAVGAAMAGLACCALGIWCHAFPCPCRDGISRTFCRPKSTLAFSLADASTGKFTPSQTDRSRHTVCIHCRYGPRPHGQACTCHTNTWSFADPREKPPSPCAPNHSRVFVRGWGWIHVSQRPNRPRPTRVPADLYELSRFAKTLRGSNAFSHKRHGQAQTYAWSIAASLGGVLAGSHCCLSVVGNLIRSASQLRAGELRWARLLRARERRAGHALHSVAMRIGCTVKELRFACGQNPEANITKTRHQLEVRYRFHNVRGLRKRATGENDSFRAAYLRSARTLCEVLVLAETNCPDADSEHEWGQEWKSGYNPIWASDEKGRVARGIVIMISKALPQANPTVACRDPEGRYLAIWLTVHGRRTLLVGTHADNDSDAEQRAFFERVAAALPQVDTSQEDVIWLGDHNNTEDRAVDYHRIGGGGQHQTRPQGVAAMQSLACQLGGLTDAFRVLHPRCREFTRIHPGSAQSPSSKARIDRGYLSSHLTTGTKAPALVAAGHIRPSDESLATLGLGADGKRSDHAAVSMVIRYSDEVAPPKRWHMPRHLLTGEHVDSVLAMRAIVAEGIAKAELSPLQRVLFILEKTRKFCKETTAKATSERAKQRQTLHKQLQRSEARLGLGLGVGDQPQLSGAALESETCRHGELEESLQSMREADHRRWLADRAYEEYLQADRCNRAMFEDARQERVDSSVRKVRSGTRTATGTKRVLLEATRFFGGKGGLFNNGVKTVRADELRLHDALRRDGKSVPQGRRDDLKMERICSAEAVQRAICDLPSYTMPGMEGFTSDYFKMMTAVREKEEDGELAPHPFCELLGEAFIESVRRPEGLPSSMASVVVSLIYKEKGHRHDLSRYRPIAVMSVLYKIMTRCMSDALQPSMPFLIAPEQNAFQRFKYIFDDNRTVQDLMAYVEQQGQGGVLLFCDQKGAYPRIQFDFLYRVLGTMGLHDDFIMMVKALYANARVHMKVNGVVGDGFRPRNALHQGCCVSPLLYILCLQTFMSLMATDDGDGDAASRLRGLMVPSVDREGETEVFAIGYADDLVGTLRDEDQLPRFKKLLGVYERGSGAENDWDEKTVALRIGSLRASTHMPAWDGPAASQLFKDEVVRYLGIFLGTDEQVAREWEKRVTAKIRARYARWLTRGGARSMLGRNIVIKTSVMAVAWYLVSNQTPPNIDDMMSAWERESWRYFEQSAAALPAAAAAAPEGTALAARRAGTSVASRHVLVQDYLEGGMRCLNVEVHVRATYMRHVRRLLDPAPQHWKGMAMHWIDSVYGKLRQGRRLLLSACDFLAVLSDSRVPAFWQSVLVCWGMADAPIPVTDTEPAARRPSGSRRAGDAHGREEPREHPPQIPSVGFDRVWNGGATRSVTVGGVWSLLAVLCEPLAYNAHIGGVWGARVDEPRGSVDVLEQTHRDGKACLTRVSSARSDQAAEVLGRYLRVAEAGYTHMADLVVVDVERVRVRLRRYNELARRGQPACMSEERYRSLVSGLPPVWLDALERASELLAERLHAGLASSLQDLAEAESLPEGVWVRRRSTGEVCQVGLHGYMGTAGSRGVVSPAGRLVPSLEAGDRPDDWPRDDVEQVVVWEASHHAHNDADEEEAGRRARRGERVGTKDVVELLCAGALGEGLFDGGFRPGASDLSRWALAFTPTDRLRPAVPMASVDVSHLYALQSARAYSPHRTAAESLDPSPTSTTWVDTLEHPTKPVRAVRLATYRVMCEPCWPRLTRELHWRVWSDALPMGNDRCQKQVWNQLCTICGALGHGEGLGRDDQLLAFRETARHIRLECPYAMAVIDPVARAIARAVGWDTQVAGRQLAVSLLREVGAAMVTGYRGIEETQGPFSVVVGELSRVLVERQRRNARDGGAIDCNAGTAYTRWAQAVDAVVRHSWREAQAAEAALPLWMEEIPEEDTPTQKWLKKWGGFVREDVRGFALAAPMQLADVPGASAAMPPGETRVVGWVGTDGLRVMLRLTVATRLPSSVKMGALATPEKVLVGSAGGQPQAKQAPVPPVQILRSGVPAVYVDGSGAGEGGWGVIAVSGSRGGADRSAELVAEHYGPVVVDATAPPCLGATRVTNNTAELTAFGEGLIYLRDVEGSTGPAIIRPDSCYASDLAQGLSVPHTNVALARRVRELWLAESARRGGQLWSVWVKGHSCHRWNDRADAAADHGAEGRVCGVGQRWSAWPPLSPPQTRAHRVDEATRVLRATNVFGVLAHHVPTRGELLTDWRLRGLLAGVERRLEVVGSMPRKRAALERAQAAYRMLQDGTRQVAERQRLIAAGLRPVTNTLRCPVHVAALRRYVERAGPEADVVPAGKAGYGTLRERAQRVASAAGPDGYIAVSYRHSLLGAQLVAAGFVVSSREYAVPGTQDPFRLPRALRALAFAGCGYDLDDCASYPRAARATFAAGRELSDLFTEHRETIMAQLGRYFFGLGVPVSVRRKHAKALFNALDNDGGIRAWMRTHGVEKPWQREMRIHLGHGRLFDLAAYIDSRESVTDEFARRLPGMVSFVRAFARARVAGRPYSSLSPREKRKLDAVELTAKSYFLAEAEGLSRLAKMDWARKRGDLPVTSLQHDGVIIVMPPAAPGSDTDAASAQVAAALSQACTDALGYDQPVEVKAMESALLDAYASDDEDDQ